MRIVRTDWCRTGILTWKENKGFESDSKGFITERKIKSLYINYFVGFIEMFRGFRNTRTAIVDQAQGLSSPVSCFPDTAEADGWTLQWLMWDNLSPTGVSPWSLEISLSHEAWSLISVLKSVLLLIMKTWDILEIHINVQSFFKACWTWMALHQCTEMVRMTHFYVFIHLKHANF